MNAGQIIALIGLGLAFISAGLLLWQLRPNVQRYQGTYGGVAEWKRFQRDQFWTASLVALSTAMQILAILVS